MSVVDGLRELEAAATPGPWFVPSFQVDSRSASEINLPSVARPDAPLAIFGKPYSDVDFTDAALIAAMRNALPLLLDVVAAAEREAEKHTCDPTRHGHACNLCVTLAALESAQGAERPEPGEGA